MDPRYSSSIPPELRYLSYWVSVAGHEDLEPDLGRPSEFARPLDEAETISYRDIEDYAVGVEVP